MKSFVCQRPACGKTFQSKLPDAKFCGRPCVDLHRTESRVFRACAREGCENTFHVRPSRAEQRFCSIACGVSTRVRPDIACGNCQKIFKPRHHMVKYCSQECGSAGQRGQRRPHRLPAKTCENCGHSFQPKVASRRFCCVECGRAGQARPGTPGGPAAVVTRRRRPRPPTHPLAPVAPPRDIPDAPKQLRVLIWRPESWGGEYYATVGSDA